jgi:signal transduction histidine kinase
MKPGPRKILVVDDEATLAEVIADLLGRRGYQTSVVLNGREAIEEVFKESPDLVLLDLNLPDIAGADVLKKIKEIDGDIGIVILTGYGGEQVAVDLMKAGALDFISKPFEKEVLLAAAENALKIRDARMEDKRHRRYSSMEYFFPFLAHEVRNPLHAISGALAVIERRTNLNDEIIFQSIKIIQEEIQHLSEFVQGCLNYVRPLKKGQFVEFEVNELVNNVLNTISHMFVELARRIRIVLELEPGLPKFKGDYDEIKQALLNILKNAYEAMEKGGRLTVKTRFKSNPSPGCFEIIVADSGGGIKKECMKNLFDPFFTTKVRGTGLGLAVCHRIVVERHKGTIHVESEESVGTTVSVLLPLPETSEASI